MDNCIIVLLGVIIQLCGVHVTGNDVLCNNRLIQSLPDDHLTATSSRGDPIGQTSPPRGRLNTTDVVLSNGTTMIGGWSPSSDGQGHYIQATFDHMTMIKDVLTQGRNQGNGHVKIYKIEYTEDGKTWQTMNDDIGIEKLFQGNKDGDTVQTNSFDCPIFAKGIRIIPMDWDKHVALRFDVTGCYVDTASTATTTTTVGLPNATTSSQSTTSPYVVTTTATTTPTIVTTITTLPTTKTTTKPTTVTTTIPTTVTTTRPTTVTTSKTTTTTKTIPQTTPRTTVKTTTSPYMFHPGIQNPFGTTTRRVTTTTVPPFHPGIQDPFGPGQLIG